MLLFWGTLYPQGVSKFASVRFASPVKIRYLRLYPKGCTVFSNNTDIVSQTEPEAFNLNVFINAQALPDGKEVKARATNNLTTTSLHYAGGMREFALDIGSHYTTRLLILQGDFTAVTVAVYGDVSSEPIMDETLINEHTELPNFARKSSPLTILDPINLSDPIMLPKELLNLVVNPLPLPQLVRLQFCLKLQDLSVTDDVQFVEWSDILNMDATGLDWLERAATMLSWPTADNVDLETLRRFSSKVIDSLAEKTNDSLFIFSGLIRRASAQPESVVNAILDNVNLSEIFDSHLLDKHIIERLHDAAAHPTIARHLGASSMIANIDSYVKLHKINPTARQAATSLQDRIRGWEEFEKVIQGGSPDIPFLMSWVKKLISEDITCGVFLNYLLSEDFWSASKDHFFQINSSNCIASWPSASVATLPEFLMFLKAFISISSTLAVFSWAVNLNVNECIEKTLSIARLWQEIPSYKEVTNEIFVLSRVLYRLEDVLQQASDLPNMCTQYAEQIVSCLFDHVETMANPDLAQLVNALPDSDQSSLSDTRRAEMTHMAFIAENGLNEAVRTVIRFSLDDAVSVLHVALLVIKQALEDRENGVWNVMQASWDQEFHGLEYHLLEMMDHFVALIRSQFLLVPPTPLHPTVPTQLVHASHTILRIMARLSSNQILSLRLVRSLVLNVLNLFILTDAIDSTYPFENQVRQAARSVRPTCAETLSILWTPNPETPTTGETALRILLQSAFNPDNSDPVVRVEQVFWLLDLVLPLSISDTGPPGDTQEQYWLKEVIPNVLPELRRFFRALTTEHQVQLAERLMNLDRGEIGLGQWFLNQELDYLLRILQRSSEGDSSEKKIAFTLQISKSLRFLKGFLEIYSVGKYPYIYQEDEIRTLFEALEGVKTRPAFPLSYAVDLVLALIPDMNLFTTENRATLAHILLLQGEHTPTLLSKAVAILITLEGLGDVVRDALICSLGRSLTLNGHEASEQDIIDCFEWLYRQGTPENRIQVHFSEQTFNQLLARVERVEKTSPLLDKFRTSFIFSDVEDTMSDGSPPELPNFSFQSLRKSLGYRPTTPPTPHLNGESIFKMATTSPITTVFNSAKTVTLTKTYQQNEFRQLSIRQNTSRRPSVHVDEFQSEIDTSGSGQASAEFGHLLPPLKFE